MNFKNIPKIMNFYWGFNSKLSYLNYLTLESFGKYNPDWEMNLYRPVLSSKHVLSNKINEFHLNYEGKDYSYKLKDITNLKVCDFDFSEIGISTEIAEVYKSDFLRWHLLSTQGGGWSDMDILYFKPLTEIDLDGRMINGYSSEVDTVIIFKDLGYHPIGFYLSCSNNPYFANIFEHAKREFSELDYQSIGASLLNKLYPTYEIIDELFPTLNIADISAKTVYPYLPTDIKKIFHNQFFDVFKLVKNITKTTIGIHWYNGSNITKQCMNDFEKGKHFKGEIGKYLRDLK